MLNKTLAPPQGNCMSVARQADIPRELENIDRQIAVLSDVITTLSGRLCKVLRSAEPCNVEQVPDQEAPRTELSGLLRNSGDAIEVERRRIDDILDRLEL